MVNRGIGVDRLRANQEKSDADESRLQRLAGGGNAEATLRNVVLAARPTAARKAVNENRRAWPLFLSPTAATPPAERSGRILSGEV
jgi:hypothetical protein